MAGQRDFSYFPYQHRICHHVYNNSGCTFCGFHTLKRCVSPTPVSDQKMIQHFNAFVNDKKHMDSLLRYGKILVETNGSWFIEIPKVVREHIYKFVEVNKIELHTQCRATVINQEKIQRAFEIMTWTKGDRTSSESVEKEMAQMAYQAIDTELRPYMLIFTGLEVADDNDLKLLNKGCTLEDFVSFSEFVRKHKAMVGANVLIKPPLIQNPIHKALMTARYGFEVLRATEVSFCCCIPFRGTLAHRLWREAKWNPPSLAECSEILKQTRDKYFSENLRRDVSFYNPRVQCHHGKYTGRKVTTERQKVLVRANVKRIAEEVFC